MSKKPDTQPSLLDDPHVAGALTPREALPAVIDPPQREQLTANVEPAQQANALADLRQAALMMSPAQQHMALAAFAESRTSFRQWLLSQMSEGVHYGFPPGLIPKSKEIDGVMHYGIWKKSKTQGEKGYYDWYPETQWKPRKSLYQSGADFIIDLMGLRPEINPDADAWKMAGSKSGSFVMRCDLFSKANGEKIGNGFGGRSIGDKGGDLNNSMKMACKAAKVAAVINAYALSDLFTQDLEDMPKRPEYEAPEQDDDAPEVESRADRNAKVTADDLARLGNEWRTWQQGDPTKDEFAAWALKVTCGDWNPKKLDQWTQARLDQCWKASNAVTGAPE